MSNLSCLIALPHKEYDFIEDGDEFLIESQLFNEMQKWKNCEIPDFIDIDEPITIKNYCFRVVRFHEDDDAFVVRAITAREYYEQRYVKRDYIFKETQPKIES